MLPHMWEVQPSIRKDGHSTWLTSNIHEKKTTCMFAFACQTYVAHLVNVCHIQGPYVHRMAPMYDTYMLLVCNTYKQGFT
ncbi:50S ribosomal protein L17, partial [Frankliniella fusca]